MDIIAPEAGEIQGFNHHDRADTFPVDFTLKAANAKTYDGLLLPGGVISPDALRISRSPLPSFAPSSRQASRSPQSVTGPGRSSTRAASKARE